MPHEGNSENCINMPNISPLPAQLPLRPLLVVPSISHFSDILHFADLCSLHPFTKPEQRQYASVLHLLGFKWWWRWRRKRRRRLRSLGLIMRWMWHYRCTLLSQKILAPGCHRHRLSSHRRGRLEPDLQFSTELCTARSQFRFVDDDVWVKWRVRIHIGRLGCEGRGHHEPFWYMPRCRVLLRRGGRGDRGGRKVDLGWRASR